MIGCVAPLLLMLAWLPGCGDSSSSAAPQQAAEVNLSDEMLKQDFANLAVKRVVFAHQSVGNDILAGVKALAGRVGVDPDIVAQDRLGDAHGIAHYAVGTNGKPLGKIDEFAAHFDQGASKGADIALFKLCFIDFNRDTDAEAVAQRYVATLKRLQHDYPETRFVAITAPLTTIQVGLKAELKKLLGDAPGSYEENWKRQQFNNVLRASFDAAHLFDIAGLESSAGGTPQVFSYRDQLVQALNPALTYDGGHLNDRGKEILATAFLSFVGTSP